jgi:hypothetical protein
MGVLDDAIREHLDLKRQHGAAEDEIAREEAEALGPARRDTPAAAGGDEAGADAGETLVVTPVADVAPPPVAEPPVEEAEVAPPPVHDIDEDPLAPPPPVAGAPLEGEPAEPPQGDDPLFHDAGDDDPGTSPGRVS